MARLLFFLVAFMAVTVPVRAQANAQINSRTLSAHLIAPHVEKRAFGNQEVTVTTLSPEGLKALNGKNLPASRASEGFDVTINLVYTDGEYSPLQFYIYNENIFIGDYVSKYAQDGHSINLENIEPGTYTIMASFDELFSHSGTPWTRYYVFKEDVKIESSATIDIEAASATHQFKGISYLPNGEIAQLDNNGYDENYNPLFVPGNCLSKLIQVTIFDTKYNAWIASAIGSTGTYNMDNIYGPGVHWRPEEMYDIMVNDISDRFLICQQRDNYLENGMAATVGISRGINNLEFVNDPSNYRTIEESFSHTPAYNNYGTPDGKYQITGLGYGDWSYFPYNILPWEMSGPSTMFYSTEADASEVSDFTPYYRFQLYDAVADWNEYYIKGQKFVFDSEGATYVFSNFNKPSEVSGTRAVDSNGEEVYYEFPGNPGLEVKASPSPAYTYGNSAAINAISPTIYKQLDDIFYTSLSSSFRGLLGEERDADRITQKMTVYHNDEVTQLTSSDSELYWYDAGNENPSGVYQLQIENNNILVDDVNGFNNTTISFSYERADFCPPTIQALQFRTAAGEFAQRFENAEDVNIILCAGDYTWRETQEYEEYDYESNPITVTVEVAPHSDAAVYAWTEVPMTNDASLNNNAGYGFFYKGALKDASGIENANGWYDLRIKVVDQAGNYNEQILGPAFYVGNQTGVSSITTSESGLIYNGCEVSLSNGTEATFNIYSTDGRQLASAHGNSISLDNLSSGIYVVTATVAGETRRRKVVK